MHQINEIEIIFDNLRSYLNEQETPGAGDQLEAEIQAAQEGLGPLLGGLFATLVQLRGMADNPNAMDAAHQQGDLLASAVRNFTEGKKNVFETIEAVQMVMETLQRAMMEAT